MAMRATPTGVRAVLAQCGPRVGGGPPRAMHLAMCAVHGWRLEPSWDLALGHGHLAHVRHGPCRKHSRLLIENEPTAHPLSLARSLWFQIPNCYLYYFKGS